jgi:hypothetical protein
LLYKALYDDRQREGEFLARDWYIKKTLALPWVRKISIKRTPLLNPALLRGLVIRKTVEVAGGIPSFDYYIRVADGMAIEQERFVVLKELMHCYFGPSPENLQYATGNAIVFDTHFRQMFGDSSIAPDSPHVQADKMAVWMALGVLCPEHVRQQYIGIACTAGGLSKVAEKQVIPIKQASNLISDQYDDELARILN